MPISITKPQLSCTTALHEILLRVLLGGLLLAIHEFIPPFIRVIQHEEWWKYQNPVREDTVPVVELGIIILLIPIISHISNHVWSNRKLTKYKETSIPNKFHYKDWYDGLLAYSLSGLVMFITVELIKITVGRPRPDYFNRCFPDVKDNVEDFIANLELNFKCHTVNNNYTAKFIADGRKSFPSGHSATAWFSGVFLAMYVWGKTRAFAKYTQPNAWRFVSGFLFLLLPLYVSISRTQDYRHHWEDVTVGGLIGIVSSIVCYRLYYPELTSEFSNNSTRQLIWRFHIPEDNETQENTSWKLKNQRIRETFHGLKPKRFSKPTKEVIETI